MPSRFEHLTSSATFRTLRGDRAALKGVAASIFGRANLSVEPSYHDLPHQRARLIDELGIQLVLDVGANVGQYAGWLRSGGYEGRIISFEANPETTESLRRSAAADPRWDVVGCALGAQEDRAELFVTVDSLSTSLLASSTADTYRFMESAPGRVDVDVRTLDSFGHTDSTVSTLLKLDVQGFELEVLKGGPATLAAVAAVECELSLRPLYDGQALIEDVIAHLRSAGFRPICLTGASPIRRPTRSCRSMGCSSVSRTER